MQPSGLAIETMGLTKQFGRHCVVDTPTLAFPSGSVFGFLGQSGTGKTTTIHLLLGLIRPTSRARRNRWSQPRGGCRHPRCGPACPRAPGPGSNRLRRNRL